MDQKNNNPKRVAVIGASGYGGLQAIRLLKDHPFFQISYLGGKKTINKKWNQLCPFLPLEDDPTIQPINIEQIASSCDIAILSLPNGLSAELTPELLDSNIKVVDLSADFRYRSLSKWKEIYLMESNKPERIDKELCARAIYGLPEWNGSNIAKANLVASPGCFHTASLLLLIPFLKQGLIEKDGIIIDAKSGTSGGGREAREHLLLSEASETFSPYSVIGHRHTSEIEQELSLVSGTDINLQFTPHLVPMVRGILCTAYARLRDPCLTAEDCKIVLEAIYRKHKNIEVLPVGTYPNTKWVRYTNKAHLSVQVDKRTGRVVLMSAIDNLLKGQAGQAIQSLNLMSGLDVDMGLPLYNFYP